MKREDVLRTAESLITGDRAASYGSFEEQMKGIALAFTGITGKPISPADVALILQILKLRRFQTSGDADSLIDLAGYTALTAEAFISDGQK